MRLSDGVEWGVHVCTVLAVLPADGALPAARLAEYHGVPAAYLAKHLQAMARAGVLETVKGPRGGYRLARLATEITVLDVVEAIDGTESAFVCTEIRRRGPTAMPARYYPNPCGIHRAFDRGRRSVARRAAGHDDCRPARRRDGGGVPPRDRKGRPLVGRSRPLDAFSARQASDSGGVSEQ